MGRITNAEMNEKEFNNYRAVFDGDEYEFHAVSVRQAFYLAFEHFGDECLDALMEIDQAGDVVEVHLDKEDEIW